MSLRSRTRQLALSATLLTLFVWCLLDGPGIRFLDVPIWNLQSSAELFRFVIAVCWRVVLLAGLVFASTYMFVSLCYGSARGTTLNGLLPLGFWIVTVTTCALLREGFVFAVIPLYLAVTFVPFSLAILGGWIMQQRKRASHAMVGVLAAAGLGLFLSGGGLWLIHQDHDLPIGDVEVSSEDRIRLARYLRDHSPRSQSPAEVITLRMSDSDLNKLMSWGLSLGAEGRAAYIDFSADWFRFALSLETPYKKSVFINVIAEGRLSIHDAELDAALERVSIGRLVIPGLFINWMLPGIYELLTEDKRIAPIEQQVETVRIADGELVATYRGMAGLDLPGSLRGDLFGSLGDPQVLQSGFSQHMHALRAFKRELERGTLPVERRFDVLIRRTFGLAQERALRSPENSQVETRVAIVALGITLGHQRIAEVVSNLPPGFADGLRLWSRVPLQGRVDWTRHFWVSAALTVLSEYGVSVDIGQLKEELDASGGSGFSFADLGADRAGAAFAQETAGSFIGSKRFLSRSHDLGADAIVPILTDLPENIELVDLDATYGGTNGIGYTTLVEEIDARIQSLHRSSPLLK